MRLPPLLPIIFALMITRPASASPSSPNGARLASGDHFAILPGIRLHYVIAGNGPLLFATSPGWGATSMYLQNGLKPLEAHHRIVFIDTRGSGKSSQPEDPWQMASANMADDIDQLRQYLGVDMIDLVGHSNGGAIAISYAERYQPHLHRLILIDSQLIGFNAADATSQFLKDGTNDPRYKDAVFHLHHDPEETTNEEFAHNLGNILPLYFHDPSKYAARFEQQIGVVPSVYAEHTQSARDKLPTAEEVSHLVNVTAKTLIMEGKYDWICPPIVAEQLQQRIQTSKLAMFDQSGHLPWIEEPTLFFHTIEEFLNG